MRLALVPRVRADPRCSSSRPQVVGLHNFNHCFLILLALLYWMLDEKQQEKNGRVTDCRLTSNVTVFRVAPSIGERVGASRRKIDLGVEGLSSAAAMPPPRQAD